MALLNRARGDDWGKPFTGKYLIALYVGLIFSVLCWIILPVTFIKSLYILAITAIGFMLWAVPGWGKYFCAFHGKDTREEHEEEWIDYLTDPIDNHYLRGTVAMSLRGLYLWPLFIGLSFVLSPYCALLGVGMILQGPLYHISKYMTDWEPRMAELSEYMTGLLIGVLFSIVIWMS